MQQAAADVENGKQLGDRTANTKDLDTVHFMGLLELIIINCSSLLRSARLEELFSRFAIYSFSTSHIASGSSTHWPWNAGDENQHTVN